VRGTASGSASSTRDEIRIASPPSGEPCPQKYPGLEEERLKHWKQPISSWEWATTPSYNVSFYFESAGPIICGYLTDTVETKEYSFTYETVTLASTELQVGYGPSQAEVEKTQEEKQDQELAVARQRGEEERAAEAAKAKYEAEAPARQAAKEAAEAQAKRAAEAKAREAAERLPVSLLQVETVRQPGGSSSKPGRTKIEITTNPYAHVTITLNHHAGTFRLRASSAGEGQTDVAWSCNHPDLTYHYAVTATGGSGAAVRRSGSFRTVSDAWCAHTKKREAAESAQEAREQARQPAKTAVVNELKRTYKIGSDDEEVHCNRVTTSRYTTPGQ
jgi:hypothetical protein